MVRGPSRPAFHCISAQLWRTTRAGQLIIAFMCNLPPLWCAARPRGERSVGSRVIICLLFHLPTFMARYGVRPERASLSLPFCAICPRHGTHPSSERAFRRRPSYHLPFASFAHLYGALLCGPAFHCLSAQFSLVMARGPSRPAYHCLLRNLPRLWRAACPWSERSVGCPIIFCLLFHLPTFLARSSSGPAFHCLVAQFSPLMVCGPSRTAYHCLYCPLGRRPKGLHRRLLGVCVYVCHRGHMGRMSRCRLVGSCVPPGEDYFT